MPTMLLLLTALGHNVQFTEPGASSGAPPPAPVLISPAGEPRLSSPAAAPVPSAAKRIDLELEDADIRSVLRLMSEVSGLNFVLADGVEATVTVYLQDVPWDAALAAILSAHGLGMQPVGPGLVIIERIGG